MKLVKRLPTLAPYSALVSATSHSRASYQSGPRRLLSLSSGRGGLATRLATVTAAILLGLPQVQAVGYHVTTAQELQNALTDAAANGADDIIYLAAGYYTGNFNFNSAENRSLLIQGEDGTTNTQITIDGAGTGRDMNLANSGAGNFTVRGLTFLRNCGDQQNGALRVAGAGSSTIWVESCRFLMPTNTSAAGRGLDLASGLNATVTNCIVIGRQNKGIGVMVQGVSSGVVVANCTISENSGTYYREGNNFGGGGLSFTSQRRLQLLGMLSQETIQEP